MSAKFELNAEKRDTKGTGASRRLRRAGKVPAVIYGGGKDVDMVMFDHAPVYHMLENEAFHTSILTVNHAGGSDQAILRDVHMHPFQQQVMHMDLQRVSAKEKIHMSVPLHFSGEEIAPGVKQQGGIVSHLLNELDITCLPHQLPEYLTADVSKLHVGESVHISDLPLPEGVEITAIAHGGDDLAVATVIMTGGSAEEEEEVAAEAAAAEAAAAEAASAAEEKKEGE